MMNAIELLMDEEGHEHVMMACMAIRDGISDETGLEEIEGWDNNLDLAFHIFAVALKTHGENYIYHNDAETGIREALKEVNKKKDAYTLALKIAKKHCKRK